MHTNADYEIPSFLCVPNMEKRSIKNNAPLHNKSYFIESVLSYIDKTIELSLHFYDKTHIYTFPMFITKSCKFLT